MSQSITPIPITNIYPWQVISEYHYPWSITTCILQHHSSTHHQHLPLAGYQWLSPSMSQSITLRPSPTSTPGRSPVSITIHVSKHQPCTHQSTPGRSPVSITIHVPEHHLSTHHQHLSLAGHQWVSPSMSQSISPIPITNIYPWQVTSELTVTFLEKSFIVKFGGKFGGKSCDAPYFASCLVAPYTEKAWLLRPDVLCASSPRNVSRSWQSWIWLLSDKQHLLAVGDSMGTLHILEIPWSLRLPTTNEVCTQTPMSLRLSTTNEVYMYSDILHSNPGWGGGNIWHYHLFLTNTHVNSRYQSSTSVVILALFHYIQSNPEAMEYTGG